MRWLWKSPKDGGWLLVEPVLWLKCWNSRFHPLIWEREEGLEVDISHQWHHQLNGHKSEQALGDGEGQGSLGCCSPWGHEESHTLSHWKTTANGQWFNQPCLCKVASRKSKKEKEFRELPSWWTCGDSGEADPASREGPRPFPTPCTLHRFHLTAPELHPFIKHTSSSKMFLWVLWAAPEN